MKKETLIKKKKFLLVTTGSPVTTCLVGVVRLSVNFFFCLFYNVAYSVLSNFTRQSKSGEKAVWALAFTCAASHGGRRPSQTPLAPPLERTHDELLLGAAQACGPAP